MRLNLVFDSTSEVEGFASSSTFTHNNPCLTHTHTQTQNTHVSSYTANRGLSFYYDQVWPTVRSFKKKQQKTIFIKGHV